MDASDYAQENARWLSVFTCMFDVRARKVEIRGRDYVQIDLGDQAYVVLGTEQAEKLYDQLGDTIATCQVKE